MSFGHPCLSGAAEGDPDVIDWYHTAKRAKRKRLPETQGGPQGARQGRLSQATAVHGPVLIEHGRVLQRGSRLGEWAYFKRPRLGERVWERAEGDGEQGRRLEEPTRCATSC
jgi:hypothetical protein